MKSAQERLRRLAAHWEASTGRTRAERLAASALLRARPSYVRRRRPRLVTAAAAGAVLVGVLGLGALADQAVPGQVLYPVDRAYESIGGLVGIGQDRSEERLVEALALIDRGREVEAVELIDEAIEYLARQPDLQVALVDATPSTTTTTRPVPAPPTTTATAATPVKPAAPTGSAGEQAPVVVAAADASTSLRLAAEFLLQTVRDRKSEGAASADLSRAATELIAAAQVVKDTAVEPVVETAGEETTTTVEPSETTTTSEPSPTTTAVDTTTSTTPGSTTSTTEDPDSTTTTTTEPGDQGPGPIIIPPQP